MFLFIWRKDCWFPLVCAADLWNVGILDHPVDLCIFYGLLVQTWQNFGIFCVRVDWDLLLFRFSMGFIDLRGVLFRLMLLVVVLWLCFCPIYGFLSPGWFFVSVV